MRMVQVVTRKPVGKMLATIPGLSLYYLPTGPCDATCQSIWPPLTLPKGSTAVPTGTACLGTVKLGNLRQVTYRRHPLYTFYLDSGTSVSGGQPFVPAKVTSGACPK
jgi:predicted lipoprotein with Yx(FWY)xxD motif